MKIILTENQYSLLESLIDEASTPMSNKIEKGGYIQVFYLVGDIEKSNTLQVAEIYGTGKFVLGLGKSGKFIINLGGSLDTIDNTFTILKNGEYKEGATDANGKVAAPEVVGGTKVVVKNVTSINISDANKNTVDTILTDLGEEKKNVGDESEEERRVKREKKVEREAEYTDREKRTLEMLLNDPTFKKAAHFQPYLLKGLIKYGKAKGFGPAKTLMNKYKDSIDDYIEKKRKGGGKDGEFSEFKVGKVSSYSITNTPINISHGSLDFTLDVGKLYRSKYIGKQYLSGAKYANGTKEKVDYKIYLKENRGGGIYSGTIKATFKEKDGSFVSKMFNGGITIKINEYIVK